MPKVFLLNSKCHRPCETMVQEQEENVQMDSESDRSTDSPKENRPDPDSSLEFPRLTTRYPSPTNITIYPSVGSAFNHVGKRNLVNSEHHTLPSFYSPEAGVTTQTYPPFGYPVASSTPEEPQRQLPLFFPPQIPTSNTSFEKSSPNSSPKQETSALTVDPNVPFSTYLENLTKVLQQSRDKMGLDRSIKQTEAVKVERHYSESKDSMEESMQSPNFNRISRENSPPHVPVMTVPSFHQQIASSSSSVPMTSTPNGLLHASLRPNFNYAINPAGFFQSPIIPIPGMSFRRHANPNKPPALKKYKCDVCGKAFSRSNTLVTHKRIHTGDKPFKCELCGRAFRQPGNLTRHRLTHTTVKPYVCPSCNKAFNRASNLHTHMRTHTNFKPFVCPYCGKGFHQKIDMKIHCYTHTGERPHKCDVCGKGFTLSSTLNTHKKIHGDTRSFHCPRCGKNFYNKNDLKNHLLSAHAYAPTSGSV